MKKVLLVIAMLTVLLMTGCSKDEKIENSNLQENNQSEQMNTGNVIQNDEPSEEEIKNLLSSDTRWVVTTAYDLVNNKDVSIMDVYGSSINESNNMTFSEDGTFKKQIGSYAENYEGTYIIDTLNSSIIFTFETGMTTKGSYKYEDKRITSISITEDFSEEYRYSVTLMPKELVVPNSVDNLLGSFSWSKNYINDSASELNLKVELVLKSDGSAEYSASDGYSAEKTRGSFEYKDGKIIYTREYYNYKGDNGQAEDSKFDDENNMTETFIVIDANTLQCVYRDQTALLTKENSQNSIIPLTDLYGTYSWEKNYTNDSETEINLKVELVLKSDGSAEYSASDGYSAEKTRGSFEYKDGKIIYIREYNNYKGANGQIEDSKFDDENNMTETFIVNDANTLQSIYHDQTVTLKK